MDNITDGRALVVAALAEPTHRLLKEALGRLVAAEAMLEAMTGGVLPDDPADTPERSIESSDSESRSQPVS